MLKDELIDFHVSTQQCKKAVSALRSHALQVSKRKEEKELLPGKEDNIWLVLTVKKTHPEKKLKPFKIPVVHPLVDPRTTPVCLITKDPQREYKDLLESHNVKFISRVVGIAKLKGKFKPFEARRLLLKENGMFLADDRVIPLLPGLLGSKFFEAKKQPIPVCLTRKDLKGELERAISSTYMHQNRGTCTSVKIATVSQTPDEILANLKSALPAIVKNIKGGWENVQSFNLKTNSSVSLPVWACDLGHGDSARWGEPPAAVEEIEWSGFGDDVEKETADINKNELVTELGVKKGKKRGAEDGNKVPTKRAKQIVEAAEASTENGASDIGQSLSEDLTPKNSAAPVANVSSKLSAASIDIPTKKTSRSKASLPVDPPVDHGTLAKKTKKAKAAATIETSGEEPIPAAEEDTMIPLAKKQKKKAKTVDPTLSAAESASPSASTTKLKAVSTPESQPEPTTPSLSKHELKHKRSTAGMDRKKDKVTKGKTGKGAKESIVGSAAKARP